MFDLAQVSVCFVAGTLGQGGAERQLFYMLKALKSAGARVSLACLTRGEFWEQPIRDLDVPVTWAGERGSRLMRLRRLVQIVKAERPRIVQSAHFYTNLYATLAARAAGARDIGAVRNDVTSEVRANGHLLGRWSLRAPRVIAANSALGVRNACRLGVPAPRCFLLPNVVDTERFRRAARNGEGHRGPVRLLAVGRLVEQKRMDRFLRLLAQLRTNASVPVTGVIAGQGPLRESLERQAEGLGLRPDGVTFLGAVADLVPCYHAADLLVLASDWEGTPNVVLEAAACGLPAVVTDAGGAADVVREGETGFVRHPEDEAGLAEAARRLVEDAALRQRLGGAARAFIESRHSEKRLPEWLAALYEKALA
jgi:glycosyltransferase involved in cell wall biosynthesis